MSKIARIADVVYPTFSASANSFPICVADYAWGSLVTGASISYNTITFKTAFGGKDLSLTAVPSPLITMVDVNQTAIATISSVSANETYNIPPEVFKYYWLIVTVNTSITIDKDSDELLLNLKG